MSPELISVMILWVTNWLCKTMFISVQTIEIYSTSTPRFQNRRMKQKKDQKNQRNQTVKTMLDPQQRLADLNAEHAAAAAAAAMFQQHASVALDHIGSYHFPAKQGKIKLYPLLG